MVDQKRRRNTRQRQVILEELSKLTSHPTAAKLHEIARRRLPKLSLGTVYRNLELLAKNGAIQKLETGGTQSRFDANPERHCHIRCVRCGRVDDLRDVPADFAGDAFKSLGGYDVIGHHLEFVGICPACKQSLTPEDEQTPRWEAS